ncbi:MAG: lipocalin family protein [Bacteroidetes bacterium]|nr:lipocalin family protein [Bacteroidota bacterium]
MKKITLLFAVTLLLFSFGSCKKDAATTAKNTLTSHNWLFADYSEDGVSLKSNFPACSLDDQYIFKDDGTYTRDEGATKCATSQTLKSGNYTVSADGKMLEGGFNSGAVTTIEELTSTSFKFSYSGKDGTGKTVKIIESYKK